MNFWNYLGSQPLYLTLIIVAFCSVILGSVLKTLILKYLKNRKNKIKNDEFSVTKKDK